MKLIIFVRFWISENPSSIWLHKQTVRLQQWTNWARSEVLRVVL